MLANLLGSYKKEKVELEIELSDLCLEILKAENETMDISREIESLKQYAEITELNRKIVTNLIKAVYISEPEKNDGQKFYEIEIRYKFRSPSAIGSKAKKEDTSSSNEISSESSNAVAI